MLDKLRNIISQSASQYSVRQIVGWLWVALRGNRLQATVNATIGLVEVALSLMQVWAVKHAIDIASGVVSGNIYWAVALMALLILLEFSQRVLAIWIRNVLGVKAQNRMQRQLIDRLLRSKWHGRDELHSGDVLNRLELDVQSVVTFITETLPSVLSTVAMLAGAFFYLYSMDAWLSLVTVGIVPIFAALSKLYVRQMRHYTRLVRSADSSVQTAMQETLQHRLIVKTMETIDMMVGRIAEQQQKLQNAVRRRTRFTIFSSLMLNFGFALGYLIAFAWAAVRMAADTLSFGGMTAFLQLVNRIQTPARDLTKLIPACANVFTAAERLMELDNEEPEEQGEPIMMQSPCGIRLDNVSYAYDGSDHFVIENLSYVFRPGSCTAILGETGTGKTTLARLLLSIVRPNEGSIKIYDDEHEEELSPRLRCNMVYVPQGNTLLSGTIRENLLQGSPTATDAQMEEALRQSCAEFVLESEHGLDTPCTELGGGLSEGQAQRIAIARALLRNRAIMLLDEATSALDPATERRLLDQILRDNRHTIVFITHRKAVLEYCTDVLKL